MSALLFAESDPCDVGVARIVDDSLRSSMSRRAFLCTGGALVVAFSLLARAQGQDSKQERSEPQNRGQVPNKVPPLPGSLEQDPMLDSWIRIGADGTITVFTGKAELGQGIKTALLQIAAEELVVTPSRITLVTADTGATPNEGYTAGSQSMQHSGTALLNAAAQVRGILASLAAQRFNAPVTDVRIDDGVVRGPAGQTATYAALVTGANLHVRASPQSPLSDPKHRRVMGTALPRVDIPAKVTGGESYVQGPSCAVARTADGQTTVWTHTQGVYPLRSAIAELLRVAPDRVRCIHVQGSGCYGHNGADDAGADAALISTALPGRHVRVQWMREDEHAWEPYGSAMIANAAGRVDASGRISDWRYEVWSHTHSTRPGPAGNLVAGWHVADATGVRVRDLPLDRERLRAAFGLLARG